MRARPRLDSNQKEIVDALLSVGAGVQSLAMIGCGCPDLLVSYREKMFLLELKVEGGMLTKDQESWIAMWQAPVSIVRSVDGALKAIGAKR